MGKETHTVREWEQIKRVKPKLFAVRISKGWDPVEAVTTPPLTHGGNRTTRPRRYYRAETGQYR